MLSVWLILKISAICKQLLLSILLVLPLNFIFDHNTIPGRVTDENLLNVEWNEAQFDTESRFFDELAPVSELHYTPGTPFFVKCSTTLFF